MTHDEAMSIVIAAADKWLTELHDYIIPCADGESVEGYEKSAAEIETALKTLETA